MGHLIGVIKSMTSHGGEKDSDPWIESEATKQGDDRRPNSPVAN
jgi:hypothetical protein